MCSRKYDPASNVKFVKLVESKPCLWNSTLPEYSKKDEVEKGWQEVAKETKLAVRDCQDRWRTIRSSFKRSLSRRKHKYYLSKQLKFIKPFTKTSIDSGNIPHITIMIKDSSNSAEVAAIDEGDKGGRGRGIPITPHAPLPLPQHLNFQVIKQGTEVACGISATPVTNCGPSLMADQQRYYINNSTPGCMSNSPLSSNNINTNNTCNPALNVPSNKKTSTSNHPLSDDCLMTNSSEANQSFLNTLLPYLNDMSTIQNLRFRQNVMGLICGLLDNAD